ILGAAVGLFFLFRGAFTEFGSEIARYLTDHGTKTAAKYQEIMLYCHIFAIVGIISFIITSGWFWLFHSTDDGDCETLKTLWCVVWVVAKIANLIFGIVIFVKLIAIENNLTFTYFGNDIWSFVKVAGIGIGFHIVLIVLIVLTDGEKFARLLNKINLKRARKKDDAYYRAHKEEIQGEYTETIKKLDLEIAELFKKYPTDKVKKVIEELENISPMFCGFYSVDKNNNEVIVDNKKLNNFENLLNKVVEMIKSGRAENIKEALNEIEKDRVNELQQNSLTEKNRQLSNMNDKLKYIQDSIYYENGGYLDDDYWNS
ncbi:MAG: hypothetical protein IKA31_02275, partial [Clostridia bacterium]|nr:hypothetical protein [Clostridia bacterium]